MITGEASAEQLSPSLPTFADVFEQEFGYVMRTLRFLGIHPSELEDVTHDVFLHVYRHFRDYDPTRPIRPWLFGFAFRIARDVRARLAGRQTFDRDLTLLTDPGPGPESQAISLQMQRIALRALEQLDADERAMFVGHELDELAAPELAHALRIPLNTAYSRLRRARTKFASAVRSATEEEEL